MKHLLVLLVLAVSTAAHAQVFVDDFSDGDFTSNPTWTGSDALFEVNASEQLQLQDVDAGQATLFTSYPSENLNNREWRVWVKQSFSGSGNNNGRIYLSAQVIPAMADGTDATGAQGYFLQLGEAGSNDAITLYRDDTSGEAPVLVATGTAGLISGSFELRLRVIRDELGGWQIWADATGGTDYVLEATGSDNTYSSSLATGVICTYTSSNADNFYFDDWYFGEEEVDETAPQALSATALSATEVLIQWDEPVDESSATDLTNYTWNASNPSSADLSTADAVTLTFATLFPSGIEQALDVSGVTDLSENEMAAQTLNFTWVAPVTAGARDVVFNEIMADPDPPVGLPNAEFIELFNASGAALNLQDWVLVNTNTEKTLPALLLPEDGYLILCDEADAAAFTPYGEVLGISSFTSLSNAGDSLTLRDNMGSIIDVVVYTDDWYNSSALSDGGTSLEQVNPYRACSGEFNWTASSSLSGGTPGEQNSLFSNAPDTQPPFLETAIPLPPNTLQFTFNEPLEDATWNALQLEITPGLVATLTSHTATSGTLETDVPFDLETLYTLTVTGAEDCEGNIAGTLTFDFLLGYSPQPGELRITEILPDPDESVPSPNAEFVEVENRGTVLLDLSQVTLEDATFDAQVLLAPGERLVLCDVEEFDQFIAVPQAVAMTDFPGLTNLGRTLTLSWNGEVLDQVNYTDDWYADPDKDDGGYSLELINPNDPCSDGTNWRASESETGATPGQLNSVWDETPDTQAPEIEWLAIDGPTQLVLLLNEQPGDASVAEATFEIFDAAGNTAPFAVSSSFANPEYPTSLILVLDDAIPAGQVFTLTVTGLTDCWGNLAAASSFEFALPEAAGLGDVVINEILSNPVSDGADFVEVINASDHYVSMAGWGLATEDAGVVESIRLLTDQAILLAPGEIVAFTTSILAQTQVYPFTRADRCLQVPSLPTYANAEGVVVLTDPLGQVLDRVAYNEDQHFVLLDDLDGVSLERISPYRESDDDTNWHSAAQSQGFATPGYTNSQSLSGGTADGAFALDRDVFSPDNDGFEDVVQITYDLPQPGWLATVTVFDQVGRPVRELRSQELLGTRGTFSWDGGRDDGQKARMGMYVILVERFLPTGETATDKLTVALAHKLP